MRQGRCRARHYHAPVFRCTPSAPVRGARAPALRAGNCRRASARCRGGRAPAAACRRVRAAADRPAYFQQRRRVQAEFGQAQGQQQRGHARVAGDLAAHRQRRAVRARGADHLRQQLQHRRMQRRIQLAHRFVVAVGRQQVLHQVVGAHGQEIDLVDEGRQGDGRGRHLDHRADRHVLGQHVAFLAQRRRLPGHAPLEREDFLAGADHRYQHAHRPVAGGTQQRAQLGVGDPGIRQQQADAAQAQRRVVLAAQHQPAAIGLVRAQVEDADGHRPSAHAEHGVAVMVELFFLVGQAVALQEQEFGAVQAQPMRAQGVRVGHVLARFGVGQQGDVHPVHGATGLGAQVAELALFARQFAQALAVLAQVVGGRLQHHLAAAAVQDQHVAVVDPVQHAAGADHQRQVQAAGEDGAVRQRAAGTGDDADHALRLQLRQLRGGDVLAHQDFAGQALHAGRALVQEGVDAADDVVQVIQAAAQVVVLHALEHLRQGVALQAQRIGRAVALAADAFVQRQQQLRIIQQHGVQIEELADLGRQRALQALAQFAHLGAGRLDGLVQALQFGVDRAGGDALFGDVLRMRQAHAGAAERAAARCAMAMQAQRGHAATPPGVVRAGTDAASAAAISCPRRNGARTDPRPPPWRRPRPRPVPAP